MKTELQQLEPNLWLLEQPFRFFGTQIGTRTTIVRLADGRLWIHSPGPDLPAVYKQVRQLGTVAFLIAPNPFHHLFLPHAMRMFPDALAYGPRAVQKKHPGLDLSPFNQQAAADWGNQIQFLKLAGLKLGEYVFFDRASRTLLLTDLLFNLQGEDFATRLMLQVEGVKGKLGCTHLVSKLLLSDRKLLRAVCEQILSWDFERIIMCHGEVVEKEARSGFAKAMAWTGLEGSALNQSGPFVLG